jgi:anti-anti-sigma regulatory factor
MSQTTWLDWAGSKVEGPSRPPGCVLTVLKRDDVVVWLIGEVDLNVAADLHDIAERAPRVGRRLVIDGSRVTFCDSTVLRFISSLAAVLPVTIRRPSRVFADILAFSGLAPQVSIQNGPGVPQ